TKEALDFLSSLRLGVMLGILDGAEIEDLRKLMEQCQPAHLQKTVGRRLNSRERDFERARLVREVLRPEEAGGAVDGEGK
ncbi:MAG: ATP--guanido phosphotransferase, partial [Verrucomicrobia bacterium]